MTEKELADIINDIEAGRFLLPTEILGVEGFSSNKVRELLNRLCTNHGTSYLEVGVHVGSTFIPAVYGNEIRATAVDYWSDEYIPAILGYDRLRRFVDNLSRYIPDRTVHVVNSDAYEVDLVIFEDNPPDIYFYDGDHTYPSHYKGIWHYAPALAREFTLIVDDFNWAEPRDATRDAIKRLGWTVLYERLLPARYERDLEQWWNGLFVARIRK